MKKYILLASALFLGAFSQAQVTNLSEGFESGVIPWTLKHLPEGTDHPTNPREWNIYINPNQTHDGSHLIQLSENIDANSVGIVTEDWVISPQVHLSASNNEFSFWVGLARWEGDNATDSELEVRISTTGTDSADFITLASFQPTDIEASILPLNNSNGLFFQKTVDLSAYDGQSVYVALVRVQGANENATTNRYKVDDIQITATTTCLSNISGITSGIPGTNSVDLSWNTDGGEAAWNVQYDVSGFPMGSGNIISANTNTNFNISGLMNGIAYDFYVQADCGTDQGVWAGPYTAAATSCVAPAAGDDFNNPFDLNSLLDPVTNEYNDSLGLICFTDQVTSAQGSEDVVFQYEKSLCATELKINTVHSHFYTSISLFDAGSQVLIDEMVGNATNNYYCDENPFSGRACWPRGGTPLDLASVPSSMFVVIEGSAPSEEGLLTVEFEEVFDPACLFILSSVEEVKAEGSITGVYPNPGNGQYTVNLERISKGASLEILDITGKEVFKQNLNSTQGQSKVEIDLEDQSKGIYFLRYQDANSNQMVKLIKQ